MVRIVPNERPGVEIPPDFIGLSYEKSAMSAPLFDASDTALVRLFRRLGPGVLRVGGNSVDRASWDPEGLGLQKGLIAPADVSRLARFLQATDWRIIYGLAMGPSNPQAMADEASAACAAFGNRLVAFEIGNEPDRYHANGIRASDYAYSDFLKEWENDARVILSATPDASFAGPAAASNLEGYTIPFSRDARGGITLLTHHYYRANGKLPTSTIGLMLSPDARLTGLLRALKDAARSGSIPLGFRLAEANSFYNGGAPHVSDSFASALWVIDFLFQCAESGASGVNLHGGGESPGYTPIADDSRLVRDVRPEYYGMLLFSMAAQGSIMRAIVSGTDPSLSAWAVSGRDDSERVVLINKSEGEVIVDVEVPSNYHSATLLPLTGGSLEAEKATLLGGSAITADGSWEKSKEDPATVRDGHCAVALTGPGAVLAVFRQ